MIGPAAFGKQVLGDDARRGRAERTRGAHEVAFAQRQELAAHQAREVSPVDQADGQEDIDHAGAEGRGNDDHEQQVGKRVEHVGEAHQPVVDAAAEKAGEAANRQADGQDQDLDENGHRQRHARAVDQAAEHVAPDVVVAHQVVQRSACAYELTGNW